MPNSGEPMQIKTKARDNTRLMEDAPGDAAGIDYDGEHAILEMMRAGIVIEL